MFKFKVCIFLLMFINLLSSQENYSSLLSTIKRQSIKIYDDNGVNVFYNEYVKDISFVIQDKEKIKNKDVMFVHVTPYNLIDIPDKRKKYGFDNKSFSWKKTVKINDSLAIFTVNLKDNFPYKIKSIFFGQYNRNTKKRIWGSLFESDVLGKQPIKKEYYRTNPDRIVYLPQNGNMFDGDNEHFLVQVSNDNKMLFAVWTQSAVESYGNNRIMFSKSSDGEIWTTPKRVVGCAFGDTDKCQASWGFLVQPKYSKRLYLFYNKEGDYQDYKQHSGELGVFYSDDEGETWFNGGVIKMRRDKYDNPDSKFSKNWVVWQLPIRDNEGKMIVGYTQWDSFAFKTSDQKRKWWQYAARSKLIRFDNIDLGPLPKNIKITILPKDEDGLIVKHPNVKWSVCEEPSVVLLPDNRLFLIARSYTGNLWFSLSNDNGKTWDHMKRLRYKDNGEFIKQPRASAPIYKLKDGRFVLIFHNNNGKKNGFNQLEDDWKINHLNYLRNPAFLSVGKFVEKGKQPIWFETPIKILDTDDVVIPPKKTAEVATYPSLTEWKGEVILWYPDRKHYLLGIKLNKYLEK